MSCQARLVRQRQDLAARSEACSKRSPERPHRGWGVNSGRAIFSRRAHPLQQPVSSPPPLQASSEIAQHSSSDASQTWAPSSAKCGFHRSWPRLMSKGGNTALMSALSFDSETGTSLGQQSIARRGVHGRTGELEDDAPTCLTDTRAEPTNPLLHPELTCFDPPNAVRIGAPCEATRAKVQDIAKADRAKTRKIAPSWSSRGLAFYKGFQPKLGRA